MDTAGALIKVKAAMWAAMEMESARYDMDERVFGGKNVGTRPIMASKRVILIMSPKTSHAPVLNTAIRIEETKSATVSNYVSSINQSINQYINERTFPCQPFLHSLYHCPSTSDCAKSAM